MKRIRVTELFAEIRANIVAFISISMFVCLGVGLFFGIAWGGLALGNAVDEAFALGNMHDVEVQFPYGMTEDDVQKIKAVDGVTEVETGYSTFVKMLKDKNAMSSSSKALPNVLTCPYTCKARCLRAKARLRCSAFGRTSMV